MKFKVKDKPCKNCLFSENRIVSKERAESLIKDTVEEGKFFVCHCSSINNGNVCCTRFYQKYVDDVFILGRLKGWGWLKGFMLMK